MRIRLSDGTILEGAYLIDGTVQLFLYIPGGTMRDVFDLLMDPAATASMTFEDGPVESTYEGFTKLTAISDEGDMITAVMKEAVINGAG